MPETKPTVLVLTALALEYAAVGAHIEGRRDRPHPGNGTFVEVGHLPGTPWQVAAAELGEGAKNTAALTASLIGRLRPEAWHGSHALLSAARAAVRDLPDARAHFKPIATADVSSSPTPSPRWRVGELHGRGADGAGGGGLAGLGQHQLRLGGGFALGGAVKG